VFVTPSGGQSGQTGASLQTRVSDLESEVARLREQLGKAKGINDTMWETMVQRVVAEGKKVKAAEGGGDVEEDMSEDSNQRRRKRGRA